MVARVRPSVRWMARIVFPIVILIAAWQLWDHAETRRLERAYAALRPHVRERRPTGNRAPALQESAGRFYAGAAVAVEAGGAYLPQDAVPVLAARIREALERGEAPAAADQARAAEFLERNDLAVALVDRGARLPFTTFSDVIEPALRTGGVMNAERMTALATLAAIRRGDAAAAAHWTSARLQLLRALPLDTFGGSLKFDLLANAAADMAMVLPEVDAAGLESLRTAWSGATTDEDLAQAVAGYAKSSYDFAQQVSSARSWQYGHMGVLIRPLLAHRVALSLETASEALDVARRPWPERISGMRTIHDKPSIVGNVFLPYHWWEIAERMHLSAELLARGVAAARVARVAIAVEEYRRQQHRLPASLADLGGLERDAATDPFTGQPLHYAIAGTGFTLYSVADNGRDDGGKVEPMTGQNGLQFRGPRLDIGVKVRLKPDTTKRSG